MSKQVTLNTGISEAVLRPGKPQTVYVMLDIVAPEGLKTDRAPINVGFVLDRSGSMSGDKMECTKKALSFAVGHIGEADYLSLVAFDDVVDTIIPACKVTNKDALKKLINSIYPGGCTNLSGGYSKGYREVKKHYRDEIVNRVLLLTDGQANVGLTDPKALVKKARDYADKGVTLTTIGVGDDFEEDLLTAMADAGKGNFYYIQNTDEIPKIFQQELQGLLSMVAHNLHISVRTPEHVKATGILGYLPDFGETVEIDLPDMYAYESKKLVLELQVDSLVEGIHELVDISLTYDDVLCNQSNVELRVRHDVTVSAKGEVQKDKEVLKEVELFRITKVKEDAVRLADEGDFAGSQKVLCDMAYDLSANEDFSSDDRFVEEMNELQENISMLANDACYKTARKQMNYQIYQRRRSRK